MKRSQRMKKENRLNLNAFSSFVKKNEIAEFQPLAYYDANLDSIIVQKKDCSFWEEPQNRFFTLWYENHSENTKNIIGFTINGVRNLFIILGLSTDQTIMVAELLNKILENYSDQKTFDIVADIKKTVWKYFRRLTS